MTEQHKIHVLPPENLLFSAMTLGSDKPTPFIFRVSYVNPGKKRFAAEAFAVVQEDTKTKARHVLLLQGNGKMMSLEEFDAYVKAGNYIIARQAPPPIEKPEPQDDGGRKSENVTLDVQSGSLPNTGRFKKQ